MELKNCPFCGRKPVVRCIPSGYTQRFFEKRFAIECSYCECDFGSATVSIDYDPYKGAKVDDTHLINLFEKWNRRNADGSEK